MAFDRVLSFCAFVELLLGQAAVLPHHLYDLAPFPIFSRSRVRVEDVGHVSRISFVAAHADCIFGVGRFGVFFLLFCGAALVFEDGVVGDVSLGCHAGGCGGFGGGFVCVRVVALPFVKDGVGGGIVIVGVIIRGCESALAVLDGSGGGGIGETCG